MNKKFIYTLSDPNTNLVRYIGKTNNIRKRFKSHLSNSQLSEPTKKNNWIISLLRRGELPIIELLDEVDPIDVNFYETFYISLFRSWGFDLLNGTDGGDGFDWIGRRHSEKSKLKNKINSPSRKSVAQLDLDGNLIKEYHSIREAANSVGGDKTHISRVCNGKSKTSYGFKWKFIEKINKFNIEEPKNRIVEYDKPRIDSRMKKVQVFNLSGDLLDICHSVNQTSKKYNCHRTLIEKCCIEKSYYQTKNLTFRYVGDAFDYVPYKYYRPSKSCRVGIYSEDNELVKSFDSIRKVVEYTGIGKQYISKNCKENGVSGNKKLKNFIFRFI